MKTTEELEYQRGRAADDFYWLEVRSKNGGKPQFEAYWTAERRAEAIAEGETLAHALPVEFHKLTAAQVLKKLPGFQILDALRGYRLMHEVIEAATQFDGETR